MHGSSNDFVVVDNQHIFRLTEPTVQVQIGGGVLVLTLTITCRRNGDLLISKFQMVVAPKLRGNGTRCVASLIMSKYRSSKALEQEIMTHWLEKLTRET